MIGRKRLVDGILLLYHHPPVESAPTVMEHIRAFARYSRYPIFAFNTDTGGLGPLRWLRFPVVILHYSVFGGDVYLLPTAYLRYLDRCHDSYKVAFFQDEFRFVRKRSDFLDHYEFNAVYTLLEPEYHATVYGQNTSVSTVRTVLTGYVSEELVDAARRLTIPEAERTIDVGYRGRRLPLWMGRGTQEKHQIAEHFPERAQDLRLRLDIETSDAGRIYGSAWYRFVANCIGMLGVEAGSSLFDLDDTARERVEVLLADEPDLDFDEVERRVLHEYEGKIPYRTVSPRHFEAAAFRVVQILYEGRYSGVLEPNVHYLALKKDWSNFDDVMARFADPEERRRITDRAYEDLIASGRYSYASFFREFDNDLEVAGLKLSMTARQRRSLTRRLDRWQRVRLLEKRTMRSMRTARFPGRPLLVAMYRFLRRDR